MLISPIRGSPSDDAEALKARLYAMLPRVRITDLLVEVAAWSGFADRFVHARRGKPAADQSALMGAILAGATNLGLGRMAESSRGLPLPRLRWTAEWHVRDETYLTGLAAIVDCHTAHPLAQVWGPGDTSSLAGDLVPGLGGIRKMRFAAEGGGTGGIPDHLGRSDGGHAGAGLVDLREEQAGEPHARPAPGHAGGGGAHEDEAGHRIGGTMAKRTDVTDELISSLDEAVDIMEGRTAPARAWHLPAAVDVRAIRARTGLSQANFAKRFGFSTSAVREWEQGRREPEAAARVLLLVVASKPEVVDEGWRQLCHRQHERRDSWPNVIPFPRQSRAVTVEAEPAAAADLVDHDGRAYRLVDLLGHLTPGKRQAIEQAMPRGGQAAWDEAVRRWPMLAAEIAASCTAVG